MKRRLVTAIGIVLIAVLTLLTIKSTIQKAQNSEPQLQSEQATVVYNGRVTDKERGYSKEYKKIYQYRNGLKLSQVSETGKRKGGTDEIGIMIGLPDTITVGNSPAPTKSEFLRNLSCKADAVVLGSVSKNTAHLTEDETFIFTEYEFLVQDVLKDNPNAPIKKDNKIEVTRPGGLVKLNGQKIRATDLSYEPLQARKDYLLFLRFVPEANGYLVSNAKGDFVLDDKFFKTLSKLGIPEELERNDSQALLNDVRNSISAGCTQNLKEDNR